MKKIISLSILCASALALEFGGFGSISTSMGYAGVALKSNDFALYYNPALLSYSQSKFSFNLGVGFSQKNLLELTNVDKNTNKKLENKLQDISKVFEGGNGFGNFAKVVDSFVLKNKTSTNNDLKALATALENKTSLSDIITKTTTDSKLSSLIKQELLVAIDSSSNALIQNGIDPNLAKTIIVNVDTNGLLSVVDASKNGNLNLVQVANKLGDIKLASFLDSKSIDDINAVYDAVYDNEVNVSIFSGIELNMPFDEKSGLAFGVHSRALANTFAGLNKDKNQLIIKIKDNNLANDTYLKIFKKDGEIYVSSTTKAEYDNFSAFSTGTKNPFIAKTLILTEIPIGYASAFDTPYGELSVGGSLKYINAIGYYLDKGIEISIDGVNSDDIKFKDELKNPATTNTFGLDLGILYSINDFSAGLVVKNINNPKIKFQHGYDIRLNPQLRTGLAYKLDFATFAFDLDLLPNKTLSYKTPKSQMFGGGVKLDFSDWFNLRLGMAYDFKKDDKTILTGGFGLFDVFDLSVASGLKTSKCSSDVCGSNINIPRYLDLRLNLGYRW